MILHRLVLSLGLSATLGLLACESSSPSKVEDNGGNSSSSSATDNNGGKSSSSMNPVTISSSSQKEVPCSFLVTDKVWSYSLNTADGSNAGTTQVTYEINDKNLVRTEKSRVYGSTASFACRLMANSETVSDYFKDSTYIMKRICDGSDMISTATITKKGFFESTSVEDFYASVLNSCKITNGLITAPSPSTAKLVTTCDFTSEENVWEYSYGDSSSYNTERYEFDGNDVTIISLKVKVMTIGECLEITPNIDPLEYCEEGGLFKLSRSGFPKDEKDKPLFFKGIQEKCLENVPVLVE